MTPYYQGELANENVTSGERRGEKEILLEVMLCLYITVEDHNNSGDQMHGKDDGEAFLDAAWRVYSLPDRRMISSKSWSGTEDMAGDGYEAMAAAESKLLARLATEIAAGLR